MEQEALIPHRLLEFADEAISDFPFTAAMRYAEEQTAIPGLIGPQDLFAFLINHA